MNESVAIESVVEAGRSIDLVGRQRLLLLHENGLDRLQILAPDGRLRLTIEVTERGPVLSFEGPALTLCASGEMAFEAERLTLHGRKGVCVTTGGDLVLDAAGDLASRARIQDVEARLGNVNVRANDDIRLNGERVMVNC